MVNYDVIDEQNLLDLLTDGNIDDLKEFNTKYGVNAICEDTRSLLQRCTLDGRTDLALYIIENCSDTDWLYQDKNDFTELHFIVQTNNFILFNAILKKECVTRSIDIPDRFGNTSLFKSVAEEDIDRRISIQLLKIGADAMKENNFGFSPYKVISNKMPDMLEWVTLRG